MIRGHDLLPFFWRGLHAAPSYRFLAEGSCHTGPRESRHHALALLFRQIMVGINMSEHIKEQIFAKAVDSGGRLRVKSALNPILWLCALVSIPTLASGAWNPSQPSWVSIVGCAPIVVAMFGFLFLLFFDRDKLQSEDFQLKKRTIELAQQKGETRPSAVDDLLTESNPDLRTLGGNHQGRDQ